MSGGLKFVVTSEREGNAASLTRQKNAESVKNVIAMDALGVLANDNPAELLNRLPGVYSIPSDEGNLDRPTIRGLPATMNTTTVDGGMASTELVNAPTLPAGTKARLDTAVTADPRLTGLQDIVAYTVANLYVARPPSPKYNTFELATTAAIADIRNGQDVTATLKALQAKLTLLMSR